MIFIDVSSELLGSKENVEILMSCSGQEGAECGDGGHSCPEAVPGGDGGSPLSPRPGQGWPVLHLQQPQVRRQGELLRQGPQHIRSAYCRARGDIIITGSLINDVGKFGNIRGLILKLKNWPTGRPR